MFDAIATLTIVMCAFACALVWFVIRSGDCRRQHARLSRSGKLKCPDCGELLQVIRDL